MYLQCKKKYVCFTIPVAKCFEFMSKPYVDVNLWLTKPKLFLTVTTDCSPEIWGTNVTMGLENQFFWSDPAVLLEPNVKYIGRTGNTAHSLPHQLKSSNSYRSQVSSPQLLYNSTSMHFRSVLLFLLLKNLCKTSSYVCM